ncbi:MAG: hypothetical protein CMO82_12665 [Winogradskyella sp.]|uniref:Alkane 1-monooxygenase n=1 Tax=Winogradskyella poriferorum TaxID=307627 RepID=A0ABU7W0Z9_9FLAO|nr:hypothetical protein [Winogradskyella sp.]|tara:strand:+ start:1447 stop:1746 length:300 start_codon:yes stop_codon:yes gene_type:complete
MIFYTGRGMMVLALIGIPYAILSVLNLNVSDESAMAYSAFIGAPFIYFIGSYWNKPKIGVDEKTNEQFWYKPNHSLFWIPMQYWSIIWVIIGIIILIAS